MTLSGNFSPWADCFQMELLPLVFSCILEEWPKFTRPTAQRVLENRITHRFVGHLKQVAKARKWPFGIRFRSKIVDLDADSESGEVDIEVFTGLDTDVYFAFECKRLFTSSSQSRASEYIGEEGMGCFLSGQYDGHAGCGGMIGYVMNNDVPRAFQAVNNAIQGNLSNLSLQPPTQLHVTDVLPREERLHQTRHLVQEAPFIIYHMFLPLSNGS